MAENIINLGENVELITYILGYDLAIETDSYLVKVLDRVRFLNKENSDSWLFTKEKIEEIVNKKDEKYDVKDDFYYETITDKIVYYLEEKGFDVIRHDKGFDVLSKVKANSIYNVYKTSQRETTKEIDVERQIELGKELRLALEKEKEMERRSMSLENNLDFGDE
ncbi:hypothetical protein ABDJ34_08440 [Finegoldia dalianensis]|uniref:Uncharacterized protein n=1 Tax=Finegoldia dalianensis TaxID=3145239 RepID=A0ABW9KEG2_9FIRM